ncbi:MULTISPECIES: hypothetical protein [Actinosynnema]|uniref:hypothetical protein n=1 Tax=Actinosynnema TaxID=40566 RepID=UPI0020A27027|nr:hypothetical protein [Actinosynnema pretiosum]MCP2092348.1 hypothetical protein [Actinosynnema pretiosum]
MSGGGYRTVPEELRGTAKSIGGAVDGVVGPHWRPPSGDYGHAGVQGGWADFVERAAKRVAELRERAEEHGRALEASASAYAEQEAGVSAGMRAVDWELPVGTVGSGAVGGVLGGIAGGPTGGIAGGGAVGDVVGGAGAGTVGAVGSGAVGSGAVHAAAPVDGRIGRRLGGGHR